MALEDLERKRKALHSDVNVILNNMEMTANELYRAADVAHHSKEILDNLDKEFEKQTGLQGMDIMFLFVAVALQLTRIVIVNDITNIENAGKGNRNEENLHKFQEKILGKLNNGKSISERPYYASMEHIVSTQGVPYDATSPLTEKALARMLKRENIPEWDFDLSEFVMEGKLGLFKGANHRFSTLGHDPVAGLIFGTANIMTNTITCVKRPLVGGLPILTTNHVIYTKEFKNPLIGVEASTSIMLTEMYRRIKEEPEAFTAALIKQIIHIGTDMYTTFGIQFPGANLVLSNKNVETITKNYINTGDIVKAGISALLSNLINFIISTIHLLLYDANKTLTKDLYNVRTRKIIMYSNSIATSSNLIWVGGNIASGNNKAIRQLDIGGLLVTIKHLLTDPKYIRKIKEEFIFGNFNKLIQGSDC